MGLTKVQHWETRAFHDFLLARAREPFVWGGNDCALFAADGILAITGTDIAVEFRGGYTTEREALKLIRAVTGGSTIADAAAWCAKKAGMPERPNPLFAQRGDLVIVEDAGTLKAGLVHLNGVNVVCPGDAGLLRLPITDVKRAWIY